MSVLQKLTEGLVKRDLQKEGAALMDKWEATGLLEGLDNDHGKNTMARLLENQASELLREASSMAAGDVEGFASVAFPIVRRVFGGLIANDLVSVQPMSLPSGLIFFLDFQYNTGRMGVDQNDSLFGGGRVGKAIISGTSDITEEGGGFYNLSNHYSSPTGSTSAEGLEFDGDGALVSSKLVSALTEAEKKIVRFDPDLLANTSKYVAVIRSQGNALTGTYGTGNEAASCLVGLNTNALGGIEWTGANASGDAVDLAGATNPVIIRRLTSIDSSNRITLVVQTDGALTVSTSAKRIPLVYPLKDTFVKGPDGLGNVVGSTPWGLEGATNSATADGDFAGVKDAIPEIDIKVDSTPVTAVTKKLKAKWTPELGQDLNAYHNLDAEVELTSILSEQIALEIDREILNDLVQGATAGTYYWSRSPGLFVDKAAGTELGATAAAPDFTGTVSEWYETLVETINDVSAQIHRKTLRGGANFLVTSPEVANILEFTSGFRANVTADADKGTVGAVKTGALSKKWDIYVDPYFPRNVVLVGRKGGSFLESGFVYAPYVPLQVTPTIFGTEDFTPRKGVMTRYAKKMVRPDMYGLVIVRGLLGEAGAS
tara:strand:- start:30 stop:1829 length:1800 start_codon:yes stop_codon:yes gene_type:complete